MSSATTAKPSTFERSNDGTSTGETTSAASTRPSAASSGTVSTPRGVQVERRTKTPLRLVAVEHVEKLLLITHRARPPLRRRRAKPSLSSGTMTNPSARVVDDSTDAPPTASGSTRPSTTCTRA